MQQLKKRQFLKSAALMRGTRIRQFVTFAARQTHRLTRQPYLVAEVIPFLSLHLLEDSLYLSLRLDFAYEVC